MAKLDDTIRNKVLRAKPYQPKPDWNRMEALLDQDDPKPLAGFWRSGYRWLIGGILLLGLGTSLAWWLSQSATEQKQGMLADKNIASAMLDADTACLPSDSFVSVLPKTSSSSPNSASQSLNASAYQTPVPNPSSSSLSAQSQASIPPIQELTVNESLFTNAGEAAPDQKVLVEDQASPTGQESSVEDLNRRGFTGEWTNSYTSSLNAIEKLSPQQMSHLTIPQTDHLIHLGEATYNISEGKRETRKVFASLSNRLRLALGPGSGRWAKTPWAGQVAMTATSLSMQLQVDTFALTTFDVVMPGVGLGIHRRVSDRWELGLRMDLGSFQQIYPAGVLIVRNENGNSQQPISTGSRYVYASGNMQDLSSQARFQFVKRADRRFRPYWVAGAGLHFMQAELTRLEFSQAYLADPSAELYSLSFSTTTDSYFRNYQNSLTTRKSELDEASESTNSTVLRTHKVTRGMFYTGAGIDIRLHRSVSLSYQFSIHVNVNSNPIFDTSESLRENLNSDFLSESPDLVPIINDEPSWEENWTPPYFRQSLGLKITL